MYVLPTHIICHINRFVHQCTGIGSLFLSVSIAANSGWKKIRMLIINPSQLWPTFTQVILPEKLVRAARPLIKLASWRSSWERGGLLSKAGQSDTLTNLKDQSGAGKRAGGKRVALLLCFASRINGRYEPHTLKVGLDNDLALCPRCGTQERVRSVFCLCRVHLQGCFLFLPQLALHRTDNKVGLGPPGPVLPRLCYWTCFLFARSAARQSDNPRPTEDKSTQRPGATQSIKEKKDFNMWSTRCFCTRRPVKMFTPTSYCKSKTTEVGKIIN